MTPANPLKDCLYTGANILFRLQVTKCYLCSNIKGTLSTYVSFRSSFHPCNKIFLSEQAASNSALHFGHCIKYIDSSGDRGAGMKIQGILLSRLVPSLLIHQGELLLVCSPPDPMNFPSKGAYTVTKDDSTKATSECTHLLDMLAAIL